jgi:hypothetical protein
MLENETVNILAGFKDPLLSLRALALVIIVALPLSAFLGFRLGKIESRRLRDRRAQPEKTPGAVSLGAMLALLGLLLGFSFSSALEWRESRQNALVEEAAAISTAFLTADLLDDPGRTELKKHILAYAQTRLATRADAVSMDEWKVFLQRTFVAKDRIWPVTLRAIEQGASDPVRATVASSVTEMLDAHTRRLAAAAEQIPNTAKMMILLASVLAIFVVGNRAALDGRSLNWRTFSFAALLCMVLIVILDLDRPLEGTIRANPDALLVTIHEMEQDIAFLN